MSDKTPTSLREQIVSAMDSYDYDRGKNYYTNASIFDEAIMPVLQKAMDAGALLLGRNTKDRIPVHTAVLAWLEEVAGHVMMIRKEEAVVSRRQLLKIIYQFGDNAERAINDAKKINVELH